MNLKNKVITWSVLYIAIMGTSNFAVRNINNVNYGEPQYINAMLPYILGLALFSIVGYIINRKDLQIEWAEKPKYLLFLISFLPSVAMAGFFIATNISFKSSFLMPLAVTIAVGIGEEMMFRRILFVGLLKKMTFAKALIISSIIFSLLHSINVFAGMPVQQMIMQLIMTFLAGLYYALMYHYTKNIYLMIASHWLWDYVLLGGAAQQVPAFGVVTSVLSILQILIILILIKPSTKVSYNK